MLEPMQFGDETATLYPTATDFVEAFNEEVRSLYLLSFLLTADPDKAEQCLVPAIGECVEGIDALMDRERSWTLRAVMSHAIRMIRPAPEQTGYVSLNSLERLPTAALSNPFAAILMLDDFERFVFVMSILEGQSDQECANLLRFSRRDVMMARVLALTRMASFDPAYAQAGAAIRGEITQ
jgi:DNA-directed RNA polymerase specialized sigma24 family protein